MIHILPEGTLPAALALLLDVQREDGVGPAALYISTTDQNSRSLITTKFQNLKVKFVEFFIIFESETVKKSDSGPVLTKLNVKKGILTTVYFHKCKLGYGQGQLPILYVQFAVIKTVVLHVRDTLLTLEARFLSKTTLLTCRTGLIKGRRRQK